MAVVNWSVTVPPGDAMTDGTSVDVAITAIDPAGNESTPTTSTIHVDTTAPTDPTVNIRMMAI